METEPDPNVLLCIGTCKQTLAWDRKTKPPAGKKEWLCSCGGAMRLRCGWPKPDGGPCLLPVQPQFDADLPVWRCYKKTHGGPEATPTPLVVRKKLAALDEHLKKPPPLSPARSIPLGMEEVYAFARGDHEAQHRQIHELALLAAYLDLMGKRLDTGESGAAWSHLGKLGEKIRKLLASIAEHSADWRKWQKADQAQKAEASGHKMQKAQGKLLTLVRVELLPVIEQGIGKEASAREWRETMQDRAKLQKVEQDRMSLLSVHTLTDAMRDLSETVARHVSPEVLAAIKAELEAKRRGVPPPKANGNGQVIHG